MFSRLKDRVKLLFRRLKLGDVTEYRKEYLYYQLKHGLITRHEYEKRINDLTGNGEPWVKIVDSKFTVTEDGSMYFSVELDWNKEFIKFLRENGYNGSNEQQMVNDWFNDIWKDLLVEEGYEHYVRKSRSEMSSKIIWEKRYEDGKIEYF